jgi:hypothetical protein
MLRRRDIAASPVRRADEAWTIILELIADTLDRSAAIERADVLDALGVAGTIGPRLVAARHLEKSPVVLVADPVHLSIYTVSGVEAISIEENLGPVPGGSSASTWRVHLPAPEPLNADITAAIAGSDHLTTETPPSAAVKSTATAELLDLDALARRLSQDRS